MYMVNEIVGLVHDTTNVRRLDNSIILMMKTSLNRLIALSHLVETVNKDEMKTSWANLAHYYVEYVVDSLRVVRHHLDSTNQRSALIQFEIHATDMQEYLNTIVHNLSLNITSKLSS